MSFFVIWAVLSDLMAIGAFEVHEEVSRARHCGFDPMGSLYSPTHRKIPLKKNLANETLSLAGRIQLFGLAFKFSSPHRQLAPVDCLRSSQKPTVPHLSGSYGLRNDTGVTCSLRGADYCRTVPTKCAVAACRKELSWVNPPARVN